MIDLNICSHRFISSTNKRNRQKHLLIKHAFSDYLTLGNIGLCLAETRLSAAGMLTPWVSFESW